MDFKLGQTGVSVEETVCICGDDACLWVTQGSIEDGIQAGGLEVAILYNDDSHYIHLGLLSCNCMAQFH